MYALVNDVARYPEFLPWCVAAKFEDVAPNERLASLSVSRGVLRTEFTTRNTLQCDAEIMMPASARIFCVTHGIPVAKRHPRRCMRRARAQDLWLRRPPD